MSRRALILVLLVVVALVGGSILYRGMTNGGATPETMTVVSWGGELQDAEREFFFRPFAEQTRIRLNDLTFTGEYARIKAQVEAGSVEWDVVEVDSDIVHSAARDGLLEPIDYSIVDASDLMPEAKGTHGVGVFYVSTALVWNASRLPAGGQPPRSWTDLWDLKTYPGKRGLRKDPRSTLEIALLADGVAPSSLYPLDVPRALRKLDQIKSEIVWWSSGSEFQQKLISTYALASGWNGRVWTLQREGHPVALTFNQGILDLDWWIVLKGARRESAMKFINSAVQAEPQRRFVERMGYGPISVKAAAALAPDVQRMIPTAAANKPLQLQFNTAWWAENEKRVRPMWEEWLLQ